MTMWEVGMDAACRIVELLDSMAPARVLEAAGALQGETDLQILGIAVLFAGQVRLLAIARAVQDLSLPPKFDSALPDGLRSTGEPLWVELADAIDSVHAVWVSLGGN